MKKRPVVSLPTFRVFRAAALLGLSAGVSPAARAYTYTWTGNGAEYDTPNWAYYDNWVNGQIAYFTTQTDIVFGSPGPANGNTSYNDVADPFRLRSLTFTAAATNYTLTGGAFILDGGGAGATITDNSPNPITINNAITANDQVTINLGAGAAPLTLGGGFNSSGYAFSVDAETVGGSGNVLAGNITGQLAIKTIGSGTLTLTGDNSYSLGTTLELESGTLSLGSTNAIKGTSKITFGGGTLQFTAANTTDYSSLFYAENGQSYRLNTNGQSVTFASALTDSLTTGVGLYKSGAGTLTLTATNTYTGGTFVNAGTLVALNNGRALSGAPVTISPGAIVALSNTNTSTILSQGPITFNGAGVLQKIGAGNAQLGGNGGNVNVSLGAGGFIDVEAGTLSGSSSYQGIWTNNLGGLNIASGATFDGVEGNIYVDALQGAGTLKGGYNGQGSTTIGVNNGSGVFAGVIADSGDAGGQLSLTKAGTGTQVLLGNNTYVGPTTITGGTLQIGEGGTSGTLGTNAGTISDNGTLAFDRSDSVTLANAITGAGGLTQLGSGTLVVTGANSYGGTTTVAAGTLQLGNGGTTGSVGGGGIVDNGTLAVNRSDDLTLANAISGSGGLTKLAGNTLTLTGSNTFAGDITINAGTVAASTASALGKGGGNVNMNSGLLLTTGSYTLDKTINFQAGGTGAVAAASGTTLTIGTDSSNDFIDAYGNITFGAAGRTGTVVINTPGYGYDNVPMFNITVAGGTLTTTSLYFGLLNASLGGLTSAATTTTVAAGATLNFADNTVGFGGGQNVRDLEGAGRITAGTATDAVLGVQQGSFSGVIYGPGGLNKGGSGTLVLSGANTYAGPTTLGSGTLQLGSANAIADSTLVTASNGGTLAFTSGLGGVVLGGLSGDGNVTLNDQGGAAVVLTVGGDNDTTTYSGVLGGQGSLTKAGTGALTLSGANTYTGGTTVNGGAFVNSGSVSGLITVNSGGLVYGTGSFSNATISVNSGGQYGNNTALTGGSTGQAVNTSASPLWAALDRAEHAPNALPFVGPQVAATPQNTTVASLALSGGSTFNFNLQNTQAAAGTGYDLTTTGGGGLILAATTAPGNQITIRLIGLDANGNNGAVAGFDPGRNYTFTLVTGGRLLGYAPGEFTVDTANFPNATNGGTFSVVRQGNDLDLVFSAVPVPEPGTLAMLAVGVGGLLLVVRQRAG